MTDKTSIEWTDRTWNPLTGCTKVSPGCDHCYAKTMHERFNGPGSFDTVTLHPERLSQPLHWRKPSLVFVNSMSDLFHQDVPDEYIASVFANMAAAPLHTFQVLTKRHARMRSLLAQPDFPYHVEMHYQDALIERHGLRPMGAMPWPLPNVWLGVSLEDQQWADIRIPALLETPAAVRFISAEPLLGPVDLRQSINQEPFAAYHFKPGGIDWMIVGGESGRGARPMQPDWARSLRDQCVAAGVPFLFKQWGEYGQQGWKVDPTHSGAMVRMGKKNAGRELDGRTWDEYPGVPLGVTQETN